MFMMRNAVALVLITSFALCMASFAHAQTYSFTGGSVITLAHSVAADAMKTYQLPACYRVPAGKDGSINLTGPMIAEIFMKTLSLWNGHEFPEKIPGILFNYHCAPPNKNYEPAAGEQLNIPVLSQEIVEMPLAFLELADKPLSKNTFAAHTTLRSGCKLTIAQYIVAMAMLIDNAAKNTPLPPFNPTSLENGKIPVTFAIPAVASPPNWEDTSSPQSLTEGGTVKEPVLVRLALNGAEVPIAPPFPPALCQPFCGAIAVTIIGSGPIKKMALMLDGKPLCTFDNGGNHGYALDTSRLPDDTYVLSVAAYDEDGKVLQPIAVSIQVQNGRTNRFTPVESDAPGK